MSRSLMPDVGGLVALARGGERDPRPVILRVQTDLFLAAPARDRATLDAFAALSTGLLPTVDDETAAIVAGKLAPLADTPEPVLCALVRRGGDARRAVIEQAPRLTEAVLVAAFADGADLGPMLATRPDLDETCLLNLVQRGDEAIDRALAGNTAVALPSRLLELLVERGRDRPALAQILLARDDLSAAEIAPLYLHAEPARRDAIRAGIAGIASLRGSASLVARPDPACCARLVERAGDRNAERFGAELAASLGLAAVPAWRFEEPSRHELLALAVLALGLSEEDGIRIFLTLHPAIACSVRTVFHLVHLLRTTPRTTAIHLVEAILGLGTKLRPAARHAPYLGPAAARAPAPPMLSDRRVLPDRARRAG